MNILTRAADSLFTTLKSIPLIFLQSESQFVLGMRAQGRRLFGNMKEPYRDHAWVYAGVTAIAQNISRVPLVFRSSNGRTVQDNVFTALFEKPNPLMGLGQFIEAIFIWLHIRGECVVILDRDNDRAVPREMTPADPQDFEPVVNEGTQQIVGWVFRKGAVEIPFETHEILFMRFFNPEHPIRGLSPLQAARDGLNQDILANQFNIAFFENNGTPGGVVEVPGNLQQTQFNRLKQQWADNHQGVKKAHKVAVLEGGASFKQMILTQKDMDFLNQKNWNRGEILAVLRVPKIEVGVTDDTNLAIIKEQRKDFWEKNLVPKMELVEWYLWSQVFSKINGGRTWAEFDTSNIDALQAGLLDKIKTAETMFRMGWTPNQINRRLNLGLEENPWGDQGYIPTNTQVVGADGTPVRLASDDKNPAQDPTNPAQGGKEPKPKPKKALPAGQLPDPVLVDKLKSFWFHQRKRQIQALLKGHTQVLSLDDENDRFDRYFEGLLPKGNGALTNEAVLDLTHQSLQLDELQNTEPDIIIENIKTLYTDVRKRAPEVVLAWDSLGLIDKKRLADCAKNDTQ